MHKIDFFNTHIDPSAFEKVKEVLHSTLLSEGKIVADLERALTKQCGIINPVALNSGTSALHLALITIGIGKGDEVILPAQTFIASGLAILMTGATPVFADIQYDTGNIDPTDVLKKISIRTKAIMPVHWGGYPCDMDELQIIATDHNLLIIEDAAHAIGATYKGRSIGSIGDITCFSFQAIKHLTTGDGGALACKHLEHYEKAMTLRWFGIDRKNSLIGPLGEREYDLSELGYKYHLNNYAAALGLANLKSLMNNLDRRRKIAAFYNSELRNIAGLTPFEYDKERESAYWLYGLNVEKREQLILKLKDAGIPASVVHMGIHKNSVFTDRSKRFLPVQSSFDQTQVHIPVHNDLSDEQISYIAKSIKAGW